MPRDGEAAADFIDLAYLVSRTGSVEGARAAFEDMVRQLVAIEDDRVQDVRASAPGDWGIDALVGNLDGGDVSVWQAKYHMAIGPSQRRQIATSLASLTRAAENHGFRVSRWTLCLPTDLSPAETTWWERFVKPYRTAGIDCQLWSRTQLLARLLAPEAAAVRGYYFPQGWDAPLGGVTGNPPSPGLCLVPPPDGPLVGRAGELERFVGLITGPDAEHDAVVVSTSVDGPGGVGKTLLTQHLCAHPSVVDAFADGRYWLTLGRTPDLESLCGDLLSALTGVRPRRIDLASVPSQIREASSGRRILLVLDDVWDPIHLRPFRSPAEETTTVVTSRRPDIAGSRSTRVPLDHLDDENAAALLFLDVEVGAADHAPGLELARRLGNWPILLELANRQIRLRIRYEQPIAEVIADMRERIARSGPTAFDLLGTDAPEARREAFAATMSVALDFLPDEALALLRALACCREDARVTVDLAAALIDAPSPACRDLLVDLAELRLANVDLRVGQISLHDVIREYLINSDPDLAARTDLIGRRLYDRAVAGDPVACRELPHVLRSGHATSHLRRLASPWWTRHLLEVTGDLTTAVEACRALLELSTFEESDHTLGLGLYAAHVLATVSELTRTSSTAELLLLSADQGVALAALSVQSLDSPAERCRSFARLATQTSDLDLRRRMVSSAVLAAASDGGRTPAALLDAAEALAPTTAPDEALDLVRAGLDETSQPAWNAARLLGKAAQIYARLGDESAARDAIARARALLAIGPRSQEQADYASIEIWIALTRLTPPERRPKAKALPTIVTPSYQAELRQRILLAHASSPMPFTLHLLRLAGGVVVAEALSALMQAEDPTGLRRLDAATHACAVVAAWNAEEAGLTCSDERVAEEAIHAAERLSADVGCPPDTIAALVAVLLDQGSGLAARALVASRSTRNRRRRALLFGTRSRYYHASLRQAMLRASVAHAEPEAVAMLSATVLGRPAPTTLAELIIDGTWDVRVTGEVLKEITGRDRDNVIDAAAARGDLSLLDRLSVPQRYLYDELAQARVAILSGDTAAHVEALARSGLRREVRLEVALSGLRCGDPEPIARGAIGDKDLERVVVPALRAIGRVKGPAAACQVLLSANPEDLPRLALRLVVELPPAYLTELLAALARSTSTDGANASFVLALLEAMAVETRTSHVDDLEAVLASGERRAMVDAFGAACQTAIGRRSRTSSAASRELLARRLRPGARDDDGYALDDHFDFDFEDEHEANDDDQEVLSALSDEALARWFDRWIGIRVDNLRSPTAPGPTSLLRRPKVRRRAPILTDAEIAHQAIFASSVSDAIFFPSLEVDPSQTRFHLDRAASDGAGTDPGREHARAQQGALAETLARVRAGQPIPPLLELQVPEEFWSAAVIAARADGHRETALAGALLEQRDGRDHLAPILRALLDGGDADNAIAFALAAFQAVEGLDPSRRDQVRAAVARLCGSLSVGLTPGDRSREVLSLLVKEAARSGTSLEAIAPALVRHAVDHHSLPRVARTLSFLIEVDQILTGL